jgi:hypothetical protein
MVDLWLGETKANHRSGITVAEASVRTRNPVDLGLQGLGLDVAHLRMPASPIA